MRRINRHTENAAFTGSEANGRTDGTSIAFVVLAVIATILALGGCGKPGNDPKSPTAGGWGQQKEEASFFAVSESESVKGTLNNYIQLNGDIETKSSVDVYADTMGKVSRLYVNIGDRVKKDTIIAEVDQSRPGMMFVASPVRSPISGTITLIPVQVGSTITQGVAIARIAATDQIQARTDVAERFVALMRPGLDAVLSFDAYPGITFPAVVAEVSPVLDPASRTLEVKLRLVEPDIRIKPGMFARIKIITETKRNVVKVPTDAVVQRLGEYYVFVIKANEKSTTGFDVEKRAVTPGIDIDNKREIVKGLASGERIVVRGQTLLEDGAAVKIVEKEPPLPVDDPIR
jgi:membrane fusion protein (multidrug efflux system)